MYYGRGTLVIIHLQILHFPVFYLNILVAVYQIQTLAMKEEHRLRTFDSRKTKTIFESRTEKVTEEEDST